MTATPTEGPRWAVHAWDGHTWHTDHPQTNDRDAAARLAGRVRSEHPDWGVKLVDESL